MAVSGGRLDGGAHVAMISIPMLLTRRGWLGWATPYFLSLFVRLASLHAPRPRFPSSFPPLPQISVAFSSRDILFSYFCQYSFRRILHFLPFLPTEIPPYAKFFSPIVRW